MTRSAPRQLEQRAQATSPAPPGRARCRPLPSRRARPEGSAPDLRLCRVCGSRGKRPQASRPGRKGLQFNSPRNRAGPPGPVRTPGTFPSKPAPVSPKDARHSPCAPALHSAPLHRSPQTLPGKPHKAETTPRNSQSTRQPPPPGSLEPSSPRSSRPALCSSRSGESDANQEKRLREEPPCARPVTETKAQGGGGGEAEAEGGWETGWGARGERGRRVSVGSRHGGQGPARAPRGRSLTCPGRCTC